MNGENGRDLGGFDTATWTPRNGKMHKEKAFSILSCRTKEEVKNLEKESGVRYSELFRLPYFDPIEMHVIDPMHNLFLGMFVNLAAGLKVVFFIFCLLLNAFSIFY